MSFPVSVAAKRTGWLGPKVGIGCALLIAAALGPNPLLGIFAIAVLLMAGEILWRPGEPPILLAIFLFQWLQASTKIFQAQWQGVEVADLPSFGGDVEGAIAITLCSIFALAVGMRLGAGSSRHEIAHEIIRSANRLPVTTWFLLYLGAFGVAIVARAGASAVPGLTHPLLVTANMKWPFYWVLTYATFASHKADKKYWLVAFGLEFFSGLGGYFSDFKTVFIFTILALLAIPVRWTVRRVASISVLVVLLLFLSVVWTSIKSDYRLFVSGGAAEQTVKVDYMERIDRLSDLVSDLDGDKIKSSFDELLTRIAYVDYFAVVLKNVPESIAHENGAIWFDALLRPFTPRLFFPDKSDIDDSERVNQYTGLGVAGRDQGTSIGLGYIAETYIDFGTAGMMGVIFVFGVVLGFIYRYMLLNPAFRGAVGMGMAVTVLIGAMPLETSITKMIATVATAALVSWLIARFVLPRLPFFRNAAASK